jgi:hypothetical protein
MHSQTFGFHFEIFDYFQRLKFQSRTIVSTEYSVGKWVNALSFTVSLLSGMLDCRFARDVGARRSAFPQSIPRVLTLLVLGDCRGDRRRIARLSEILHHAPVSVDVVLVLGLLAKPPSNLNLDDPSREGDASATLAAVENISPRVFYVPGLHDPSASHQYHADFQDIEASISTQDLPLGRMDSATSVMVPRLTAHSMNVLTRPIRLCDDLVISSSFPRSTFLEPAHAPLWCYSLSQRLRRPGALPISPSDAQVLLFSRTESHFVPKNTILGVALGEAPVYSEECSCFVDAGSFGLNGKFSIVSMDRTDCGDQFTKNNLPQPSPPWRIVRTVQTSLSQAGISFPVSCSTQP